MESAYFVYVKHQCIRWNNTNTECQGNLLAICSYSWYKLIIESGDILYTSCINQLGDMEEAKLETTLCELNVCKKFKVLFRTK